MKCNILPEKEDSPFALEVKTLPQICEGPKVHASFQISLNVSYKGNRPVSNMVIVDVKMISGFIPLKPTVKIGKKTRKLITNGASRQ
ncbi:pregnancy zone protein-like [Rousettus aegyptiacus]|uniref:pregnancy zone protein-like n=1 Tax=Rousettus aegyptiacus TaxID=9407 RepID=UPI0007897970|nr:pregnancy zone protein-like [Rousettus aegyptiacus]